MHGIGGIAGIDKYATSKVLNSAASKITAEQKGMLRELLCGCLWTQQRKHKHRQADTSICPHCLAEPEDEAHILWNCPAWNY